MSTKKGIISRSLEDPPMNQTSEKLVADSLETSRRLLPWMPFLLQDMWVLGSGGYILIDDGYLKRKKRPSSIPTR